jgi:hypothetical protein
MVIHALQSSLIDCSETVGKSLDHEQASDRIWRMQARLKPLSVEKSVFSGRAHQKGDKHYTLFPKEFGPIY